MLLVELFLLLFVIIFVIICYSLIWSEINGIPYVPSKLADVETIFSQLKLPRSIRAIDLGSGDGRVVLMAASKFGWDTTGVEINKPFTWYATLKKQLLHVPNAHFISANFLQITLANYDVIYIYGFPEMMQKLYPKLLKECPKNTWIISNTFSLPNKKERLRAGQVRAYKI